MRYEAVLFDAADTLFTTRGSVGEIYGAVARDFGSTASDSEIQQAFVRQFRHSGPLSTQSEKDWWKDVVRRVFTDVGMVDDFDRFFDSVYAQFSDTRAWRLFPETREVLEALKAARFKLGIISNFDSRVYGVLESLEIRNFFDGVAISSETGYAKPEPEIFHAAARAVAAPVGRILLVGDNPVDDVEAATRVGIDAVLIDRADRYVALWSIRRIRSLREIVPIAMG